MPQPGIALEKLGFLTIGLFDGQDPGPGHRVTLEMIELGERLGFDSAWVRCRHLQYGISSPVAVLAAAARSRMWYRAGSLASAKWAGEHGVNLLASSVVKAEEAVNTGAEDFTQVQLSQIRTFRDSHPAGAAARVSQGLVVIPPG